MTSTEPVQKKPKGLTGDLITQFATGFSTSMFIIIAMVLTKLYPEFFMKYMVLFLFIVALGVFNFMLPHKSGFVYELNRLSKEAESIQNRAAKKAFKKFGGKLLSFIPGAEAAIVNFLLLFIQNPGIILPIFTPIIGGIVMAFNTVMDEIGKII